MAGSGRCVGVTHFSILLGSYLTGVKHRKTAILEWNDSGDFCRIMEIYIEKAVTNCNEKTFSVCGICFYKRAGKRELMECEHQGFDTAILDFGAYADSAGEEFLRCDRKFLLGSFTEWKLGSFAELASGKKGRSCGWEYFAAFGCEETADMMMRRLKIRIHRIPWLPDAFTITGEAMAFLGRFLKYQRDRG